MCYVKWRLRRLLFSVAVVGISILWVRYFLSDKENLGKKFKKVEKKTKWASGEGMIEAESADMGNIWNF